MPGSEEMNTRIREFWHSVPGHRARIIVRDVQKAGEEPSRSEFLSSAEVFIELQAQGQAGPGTPDYVSGDEALKARLLAFTDAHSEDVREVDRHLGGCRVLSRKTLDDLLSALGALEAAEFSLDTVVIPEASEDPDDWSDWRFTGYISNSTLGVGIWPVPENHVPEQQELQALARSERPDPVQARWLADLLGQSIQDDTQCFWPLPDASAVDRVMNQVFRGTP